MDSIAALRSVLMLDTPIRAVLAGGRKPINPKLQEPQKQLCFSPTSMTEATTPTPRNTSALTTTPASRGNKSSASEQKYPSSFLFKSPIPSRLPHSPAVQQSATKVLEKKIDLLEASHAELEERLEGEIEQRILMKTTYDKLSEFQTKQSSHLEQIRVSRDTFRNESIALKDTLKIERSNQSKTIAFLKNTTSTVIESERSREKESFRTEKERLKKKVQKSHSRYAEAEVLVKSLTAEIEKNNADLKKLRQDQESAMQKKIESHSKEVSVLKEKISLTETGLLEQINQERKNAEENYEKLQKMQKNRTKLKEEHSLQKEKMRSEMAELQDSLKGATDARNECERKLEEVAAELDRYRQQDEEKQLTRKEFEEKIKKLMMELDTTKDQLAAGNEFKSEKDDLERRLRVAEKASSEVSTINDQQRVSIDKMHSEMNELQQKMKDAEEHRNHFENELQETNMELDGLKQNLEEAERIELENEELVTRLKSMTNELDGMKKLKEQLKMYESDVKHKDELLRNMESELIKARKKPLNKSSQESSNNIDGNDDSVIIRNLQQELQKTKEELAHSNEKLGISKASNLNRLFQVATHRDKVRNLEDDVEELEEQLNGEIPDDEEFERKRGNDDDGSPRKRLKMGEDEREDFDNDDDDEIVL